MTDLLALGPLIAPALGAVAVLLLVTAAAHPRASTVVGALSVVAGLVLLPFAPDAVVPMLVVDGHTRLYWGLVLASTLLVLPMGWSWLGGRESESFVALTLSAAVGAAMLAGATHAATLVLGLEILSISLFGLVAYHRERTAGIAAAARYLVLAAVSSAVLLYGAALLYADTGTLELSASSTATLTSTAGVLLVLVGVAFKLGVAPFHVWVQDVYQGAPAPVTALLATVSKAGAVAFLARWTFTSPLAGDGGFLAALGVLAAASMIVGNLLALLEDDVKRLLGGSSIAQMGYLLVAVVAGSPGAVDAQAAAYVLSSLVAFGVVNLLSQGGVEPQHLGAWRGLLWRHPLAAGLMVAALLSLAGIPLTAGFVGKLAVVMAGVGGARLLLVALLLVGSALGLFYYLRLVAVMFQAPEGEAAPAPEAAAWAPVLASAGAVVGFGLFPGALLALLG